MGAQVAKDFCGTRVFLVFRKIENGLLFVESRYVDVVSDLGLSPRAKCVGEDRRGRVEIVDGKLVYVEAGYGH
jgi:hypothetical protein